MYVIHSKHEQYGFTLGFLQRKFEFITPYYKSRLPPHRTLNKYVEYHIQCHSTPAEYDMTDGHCISHKRWTPYVGKVV